MEIQHYLISLFDDKIEDNILNPELYSTSSFYPTPIGDMIREELIKEGVEISTESLKKRCRCHLFKDGKQEWVLDGNKILVRMEPEATLFSEDSSVTVTPRLTRPHSQSK